mgnify:CR=1 FL=1
MVISDEKYMEKLEGFIHPARNVHLVCEVKNILYGPKKGPLDSGIEI